MWMCVFVSLAASSASGSEVKIRNTEIDTNTYDVKIEYSFTGCTNSEIEVTDLGCLESANNCHFALKLQITNDLGICEMGGKSKLVHNSGKKRIARLIPNDSLTLLIHDRDDKLLSTKTLVVR